GAGNESRDQHHRLQSQRYLDLARGRHLKGGVGKISRTSSKCRMKVETEVLPPQAPVITLPTTSPLLVLISAPSGGGKTTLCQKLLEARPQMLRAVTCTTRPPRPRETDGVDYYF